MEPYERCWCRSGKKYKWCHLRRESQAPINLFEVEERLREELRTGYCSHPDAGAAACSDRIIAAHTVQRGGGLSAIAEAGHVLTVKPTMKDMMASDGKPSPRPIGIGKASVFPGFCGRHDDALFKPVEGRTINLNAEAAFLFAYRAIAYERFNKEAQLRGVDAQREMDRGCPFPQQVMVQRYVHNLVSGIEIGLRDVDRWKASFDHALLSGDRTAFHFVALRFDRLLPVVASCAFHPEFDFGGARLQLLGRGDAEFEHMSLSVTAFDGRTVMVLGWIGDAAGPAATLADSFLTVPDDRKADALVRLLFVQTENLFMTPSWWDGLADGERDHLNTLTRSGTPLSPHLGGDLADDRRTFLTAGVTETVKG